MAWLSQNWLLLGGVFVAMAGFHLVGHGGH